MGRGGKKRRSCWASVMGVLSAVLSHPDEIPYLFKMYMSARQAKRMAVGRGESFEFCYDMLNEVSRSFAIVIQQLNEELRDAVCLFYLVLRALDTVEDDMALKLDTKLPLLLRFHEVIYDRKWNMRDCGDGSYRRLMEEYPRVTDAFLTLRKEYREVIEEITRRMGHGMAAFIEKEVVSLKDWDEYCHYVAGLVGIGLSKLFVASGLEKEESFRRDDTDTLANSMGLFLQKTNIIRDYLEDIMEEPAPRMFWPRVVWSKYAGTLEELKEPEKREDAVRCLNELINNALKHVPDCIEYMGRISDASCFRFCAIPQIMAIGTLALCYDNGGVYEGVVKMRRGVTAMHMARTRDMRDVLAAFGKYAMDIAGKVRATENDDIAGETLRTVEAVETAIERAKPAALKRLHANGLALEDPDTIPTWVRIMLLLFFVGYALYAFTIDGLRTSLGVVEGYVSPGDMMQKVFALLMLAGVSFVVIRGKRI